jgi:hypothetical protein
VQTLIAESHREWDALPWHAKLLQRFEGWRAQTFPKKVSYSDEEIAQFPSLAPGCSPARGGV